MTSPTYDQLVASGATGSTPNVRSSSSIISPDQHGDMGESIFDGSLENVLANPGVSIGTEGEGLDSKGLLATAKKGAVFAVKVTDSVGGAFEFHGPVQSMEKATLGEEIKMQPHAGHNFTPETVLGSMKDKSALTTDTSAQH